MAPLFPNYLDTSTNGFFLYKCKKVRLNLCVSYNLQRNVSFVGIAVDFGCVNATDGPTSFKF